MPPRLLLPATAAALLLAPGTACAAFLHTVMPGESLSSIAAADGLTVAALAAANGLPADTQLISGATVAIPTQGATIQPAVASTSVAAGDLDGDDPASASASAGTGTSVPVNDTTTTSTSAGSYVVAPGDTLTAIAARAGTSVGQLAATNGLDPTGVLLAGSVLVLPQPGAGPSAPSQAPAVGTTIVGRMTWFGGPNDPSVQGAPASGLGWRSDGMAYYNTGSLGRHWVIHFPWGQSLPMTQIDLGPAPWTGNAFDMAFSALPDTPYNSQNWPNPTVTGTYEGP